MANDMFSNKGRDCQGDNERFAALSEALKGLDLTKLDLVPGPPLSGVSPPELPPRHSAFGEPDEAERVRRNAYYETHWPEYREKAIQELAASLLNKEPLMRLNLSSGKVLEVRSGTYVDADNICTRGHESYSVNATAIGEEATTFFRVVSFADTPLEPVGYYFVKKYYENDEFSVYQDHTGQRFVGEVKFVYVSEEQRGQHLGAMMSSLASVEIADDPQVEILNLQVANEKVATLLASLGFQPSGKATYGYADYRIDLTEDRTANRAAFQGYLDRRCQ